MPYRTERAEARVAQLEEELAGCKGQLVTARAEVTKLQSGCTLGQRYGGMLGILGFWMFLSALVFLIGGFAGRDREAVVQVRTVERSCSVEHAVDAVVQEAVRRALYEEARRDNNDL